MTYQRSEERGRSREAVGVDGVSTDSRKIRWPFLTPRLQNVTEKTRESAHPLIKQIWFLEDQLEISERREMMAGTFVTSTNEITIAGFWREHAKGELNTRKFDKILRFFESKLGEENHGQGILPGKYYL